MGIRYNAMATKTVSDAITHLEPIEQPIAVDPTAPRDDQRILETVAAIIQDQTGTAPRPGCLGGPRCPLGFRLGHRPGGAAWAVLMRDSISFDVDL